VIADRVVVDSDVTGGMCIASGAFLHHARKLLACAQWKTSLADSSGVRNVSSSGKNGGREFRKKKERQNVLLSSLNNP
jgi:hypothetical protein